LIVLDALWENTTTIWSFYWSCCVYPQIQIRKTPPYFIILIVCSWCDDDETLEACREVMDFSLFQKEKYFWITPMNLASEF